MKLVYIAHPLRDDPDFNKFALSKILRNNYTKYQEMHVIPISPIHMFSYLDPQVDVLPQCLELLFHCDELWVFGEWKKSTGCVEEIDFAKRNGIKIRYIEGEKEDGTKNNRPYR